MSTELSIIIPIYNSKKYLSLCLESICKQIKKKIEVILINDCSTDKSLKICNTFVRKYNFIKLINQKKNRGVAYCRNVGISSALGNYILFLDSDDELTKGSLNYILKNITIFFKNDLFVLRSKEISTKKIDKNQIFKLPRNEKSISVINAINNFNKFRATCWNFIVKKDFLLSNNIFFKDIKVFEDQVFVSEIVCQAENYAILQKPIYHRRIFEPNSLGTVIGDTIVTSCIKIIYYIGKFFLKEKNLSTKKKKFLISRINFALQHLFLNITICDLKKIKQKNNYLFKINKIILKLINSGIFNLNNHFDNDKKIKNITNYLQIHKSKKINLVKNLIKNFENKEIILFCAGSYAKIVLEILKKFKIKINLIIDNNPNFSNKRLNNILIQNTLFIKKNINKFKNKKILVCNHDILEFNKIKSELIKFGINSKSILYVDI